MPRYLIHEASGGLPREVAAKSIRELVLSNPPLSGLSWWCLDSRHVHYPDGQWHADDELLEFIKDELRREVGDGGEDHQGSSGG